MEWKVITVWECELKKDKVERTLEDLMSKSLPETWITIYRYRIATNIH